MITEAINRILDISKPEIFDLPHGKYSNKRLERIAPPAFPAVSLSTLTGLMGYIKNIDAIDHAKSFVHVVNHKDVALVGFTENGIDRQHFAEAKAILPDISIGKFMDIEPFIIMLKTAFEQTDAVEELLKFVGSIDVSESAKFEDNGIHQAVTVKRGIVRKEDEQARQRIVLKPFLTFAEIEQPEVEYVFRMRKTDGVQCGLFGMGDSAWRLAASLRIKAWFEEKTCPCQVIV